MVAQRKASRSRQRGLSFISVVLIGLFAVSAFAIGGQSIPIFLEYQAAVKAIKKAKSGATVKEVRDIFDRAAQIDDITSVKGSDLEITKEGDNVVVSFAYQREIPLAGPAYLVYRLKASSR